MSTELIGVGIALAGLMLGLYRQTDKRLDRIDRRLDKSLGDMDRRVTLHVSKGFDGLDKRIDRLDNRLGRVEDRLGRVEDRLGGPGRFRPAEAPAGD